MKMFLVGALLLGSVSSFAASVKITSFYFINNERPLAELCGKVEGATKDHTHVKIAIDPRTNRPGTYNTIAGADGKFCMVVATWSGFAEASIPGEEAAVAQIK